MSRRTRTAIGVLLSVLLLGWALRDVSFREVLAQTRAADRALFALSIAIALGGFWFRAVRWGVLLAPLGAVIPLRSRIAATFIGFAANNVLPARVGEFARAFSLARLSTVPTATAFATLVVERLFDALVLVGLLFVAMGAPGFPAGGQIGGVDLRSAVLVFGVLLGALGLGLYVAVAFPAGARYVAHAGSRLLPHSARHPVLDALRGFARGLAVLRSPSLFAVSACLALAQWVFLALSFWFGFKAFGIDHVPFSGAIFLQSFVSLAVAVPSSPGFFGPFEAAARVGLGLWDVPAQQAISFAIGFHIGGFLPVTLVGAYYVWRLNLSWSDVRHSEETVEEVLHAQVEEPTETGEGTR